MTRPSRFYKSRFFLFVNLPLSLIALTVIGAAQHKHAANAIAGRVLGDNGHPLVNADVSVVQVVPRVSNPISRRTRTDDDGSFRLTNLPSAEYQLSANADGYLYEYARASDRPDDNKFRPGATVTITLKKGAVITGRVYDANDRSIVAVPVNLEWTRDEYDRPRPLIQVVQEGLTDDQGFYRFFGIRPGSYLVRAGGRGRPERGATAFDTHAPTYHPSSSRETATEIKVRAGEEATEIDIRYRGESGNAIRGVITGAIDFYRGTYLKLNSLPGKTQIGFMFARAGDNSFKFEFEGLPDGDYELIAERDGASQDDDGAVSPLRRVTIKGEDVDGIEMRLIARSSISGRIALAEGAPKCQAQSDKRVSNVSPIALPDDATRPSVEQGRTNDQGEFKLRGLEAGRYRLQARGLHQNGWYLRAVTQPGPPPAGRAVDVSREGFMLRPGERKTGLILTVAEGAASLFGIVVPVNEGARLPARLRVHLIPAEPAAADNPLRYAESDLWKDGNGRFAIGNLAPGRYWILARPAPDESSDTPAPPVAWDAASRAKLLGEARTANVVIELKPCQTTLDQVIRYESRN